MNNYTGYPRVIHLGSALSSLFHSSATKHINKRGAMILARVSIPYFPIPPLALSSTACYSLGSMEALLSLLQSKVKVQVFDTPQVSTVLRSNRMRLYSPVDLTGNLIMTEKLVSGGT